MILNNYYLRIATLFILVFFFLCIRPTSANAVNVQFSVEAPGIQESQASGVTTETFNVVTQAEIRTDGHVLASGVGTIVGANANIQIKAGDDDLGGANQTDYFFTNLGSLNIRFTNPQRYVGFYWATGTTGANDSVQIFGSIGGTGTESLLGTFSIADVQSRVINAVYPAGHRGNPENPANQAANYFAFVNLQLE
jgi:hypothetical protein